MDSAALEELVGRYRNRKTAAHALSHEENDGDSIDGHQAVACFQKIGLQELKHHIRTQLETQSVAPSQHTVQELVELLHACFWVASVRNASELMHLHRTLFTFVLHAIHQSNGTSSSSLITSIVALLQKEVVRLDATSMPYVLEELLRGISTSVQQQRAGLLTLTITYSIELLPSLLHRASAFSVISIEEDRLVEAFDARECLGRELKQRVMEKVLQLAWPKGFYLPMIKTLRDISYHPDGAMERLVCIKLFGELHRAFILAQDAARSDQQPIELTLLPIVIYQTLLLMVHLQNLVCRRVLAKLLLRIFQCLAPERQRVALRSSRLNDHDDDDVTSHVRFPSTGVDSSSHRELRAAQSTVLYHFDLVLKQDESMAALFVDELDGMDHLPTSFELALLLTTSMQAKLEPKVQDLIIQYILKSYSVDETSQEQTDDRVPPTTHGRRFRRLLIDMPRQSRDGGWSPVIHAILSLGFRLLTTESSPLGSVSSEQEERNNRATAMVDFGIRLLQSCFQNDISARDRVMEHILNSLLTQPATWNAYHQLLSRLTKSHPSEMTPKHQTRIQECFEYITHLDPVRVESFHQALGPWLYAYQNLKHALILALRKAMFRKDEASRSIAIKGFGFLLCHSAQIFNKQRSLTQLYSQNVTMLSQADATTGSQVLSSDQSNAMMAEDLFRQFCGIFKKGFQLQTNVRLVLYTSLVRVYRACAVLRPSILDLVLNHFMKYYEANESILPPLKLDKCVHVAKRTGGAGLYEEPIAHLLDTLFECLSITDEENSGDAMMDGLETSVFDEDDVPPTQVGQAIKQLETAQSTLKILMERMKRCELSDFELDLTTSSFAVDTELGQTNRRLGTMFMTLMEVCIHRSITAVKDWTTAQWTVVVEFAKMRSQVAYLMEHGNDKATNGGAKRKRKRTDDDDDETTKKNAAEADVKANPVPEASASWRLMPLSVLLRVLTYGAQQLANQSVTLSVDELKLLALMVKEADEATADLFQQLPRSSDSRFRQQDAQETTMKLGIQLFRVFYECHRRISMTGSRVGVRRTAAHDPNQPDQLIATLSADAIKIVGDILSWLIQQQQQYAGSPSYDFLRSCAEQTDQAMAQPVDQKLLLAPKSFGTTDCLPILKTLFGEMVLGGRMEATLPVLRLIALIASRSTYKEWMQLASWVESIFVQRALPSQNLIVSMVEFSLKQPNDNEGSFALAQGQRLALGLLRYCNEGDIDQIMTIHTSEAPVPLDNVDDKMIVTLASVLLSCIDQALGRVEKATKEYASSIRRQVPSVKEHDYDMVERLERKYGPLFAEDEVFQSVASRFKALAKDVFDLAGVLLPFVMMDLNKQTVSTRALRLLCRMYKVLVLLVQTRVRRKDPTLPKYLQRLFQRTAGELTPRLLQFVACVQEDHKRTMASKSKSTKRPAATKASVQSKLIPDVIFQLEQFDVVLIKLSKICKGENFSHWCKLRQSRDFRFNKERIREHLQAENNEDNEKTPYQIQEEEEEEQDETIVHDDEEDDNQHDEEEEQ